MKKLIVVTSYPEEGMIHGKKTVGVASYAKNTLIALSKAGKDKPKITVLAEKLPGQKDKYQEDNVQVIRCWQRNTWSAYWQIGRKIKKLKAKKVMIEFEMAMFGSPFKNVFFPLFLIWLKLINKKSIVVIHQVVLDFSQLSGHLGAKKDNLKTKALSLTGKIFFKSILITANQIVVFEQFLKNRLAKLGNVNKIKVIPHGVEKIDIRTTKKEARNKLDIPQSKYVLSIFGYLAWYKGSDWLVKAVSQHLERSKNDNLYLILSGGPNPNHVGKDFYDKYIQNIEKTAKKHSKNIKIAGFIPENEINLYYQAADLMIFPYRTGMSSSGPLALAFTNHKPFLVSKPLAPLLKTEDIKSTLAQLDISSDEITFSLPNDDFISKLTQLQNKPNLSDKLTQAARLITEKRSWQNIGNIYHQELFE